MTTSGHAVRWRAPGPGCRVRDLLDLAVMLQQMAGGAREAMSWAEAIGSQGRTCLPSLGVRGDPALVLTAKAQEIGLVRSDGAGDRVRAAELVILLDMLDGATRPASAAMPNRELVFTVPRSVEKLVQPRQRLDLLINDVIARADHTLHIGGPFWNTRGWGMLKPVVLPAIHIRGVHVTFYLHRSESGHLDVIEEMLHEAREHGPISTRWWNANVPSMMHAKFIVADSVTGYFGTANLTSLGLSEHLEVGVALAPSQAASLLDLLQHLERAGLFDAGPVSS